MHKRYVFIILLLICLSSCTKGVATVGAAHINKKAVNQRARVSEVYYPGSNKDYIGLAQLIKGYLAEEVLKGLGRKVDAAVLTAEARRIDENTKAPKVLIKIKEIYDVDRQAYLNTFVLIVHAERVLHSEVFLQSKEVHKKQYEMAKDFFEKAQKTPGVFTALAKQRGLQSQRTRLSREQGIIRQGKGGKEPEQEVNVLPEGVDQASRLIDAVSNVMPGNVFPGVIEWLEGYQIIKLVRKSDGNYIVDTVFIAKKNYDDWFWEKASKIPVRIYDAKLKEEFLKEVGWAKNVKLE